MSYAAFFDFDGTIFKSVVNVEFAKYTFKNKKIRNYELFRRLPKIIYYYLLNKFDIINRAALNKNIYKDFKGLPERLFIDNSEDFYKTFIKGNLYEGAVDLIKFHKGNRAHIVVLTSSFNDILEPLQKKLGIDHLIASSIKSINGIYTGEIINLPIGKFRKEAIIEFSKKNDIDLKKCFAYSDHHSDIPMLESVGNAAVINPDPKLRKKAIESNWKIYEFN